MLGSTRASVQEFCFFSIFSTMSDFLEVQVFSLKYQGPAMHQWSKFHHQFRLMTM